MKKSGLYLNLKKKSKILSTEKIDEFRLGADHVEMVESFIFLGSKIEVSRGWGGEMNRRLALGRSAMSELTTIWKDKDVTKQTKRSPVNDLVFPVTTYGCES